VMRPGWGRLLERYGERPQLLASDVVACVSGEVAREVVRLGVSRERIVVSPTAVDAELFAPAESSAAERHALGVGDAFVVGWAGTFRRFQGLETLVEAFGKLRETQEAARLLLVGDGAERPHIEAVVDQVGARAGVVFAGAIGARAVPECLNAMDVAVVSARSDGGFHYSPLKLREYLACGRAVLAPRIGEIPTFVDDGVHALLYEPGDVDDLATKLRRLHDDPGLRTRLGAAGREFVLAHATWDTRLDELLDSAPFRAAVGRASGSA
jgi:glycosyltransferase involved in cell wall biosynthesis